MKMISCKIICRSSVQPLLVFSARTVTERTALGMRQTVEADQNVNGKIHLKEYNLIVSAFSYGTCLCSIRWLSFCHCF